MITTIIALNIKTMRLQGLSGPGVAVLGGLGSRVLGFRVFRV